jgi:hypothetical protein
MSLVILMVGGVTLMTLCSGPRQGAPASSGPMREVATELLKLLITPDIFSITPSGRYQSILPQDALGLSRSREARLTAAGTARNRNSL